MRLTITTFLSLLTLAAPAHAVPSAGQLCASAMELASAKYTQCRLTAEAKNSKSPDAAKYTAALAKCSSKLADAFDKATLRYGGACAATEASSAFDAYLTQCSDDATAAVGGAALPDYVGDLASCSADLGATQANLTVRENQLWACVAQPPAKPLKTGQTTSYGPGSDGDLQKGLAQNFFDNGDGTITDTMTGLMWEKKSDDGTVHDKDNTYSWSGASYGSTNVMDGTVVTTFLAALNAGGGFAGHTDWRLPNAKELESLVNREAVAPATFPAFNTGCAAACTVLTCSCTVDDSHWSSSTFMDVPSNAWRVVFGGGYVLASGKNAYIYARAVRGGS